MEEFFERLLEGGGLDVERELEANPFDDVFAEGSTYPQMVTEPTVNQTSERGEAPQGVGGASKLWASRTGCFLSWSSRES